MVSIKWLMYGAAYAAVCYIFPSIFWLSWILVSHSVTLCVVTYLYYLFLKMALGREMPAETDEGTRGVFERVANCVAGDVRRMHR